MVAVAMLPPLMPFLIILLFYLVLDIYFNKEKLHETERTPWVQNVLWVLFDTL